MHGVAVTDGAHTIMTNSVCEANAQSGISIARVAKASVQACSSNDNQKDGITIHKGGSATLTGIDSVCLTPILFA